MKTLLFLLFFTLGEAAVAVKKGIIAVIGDQEYIIQEQLGEGSFKTAYRATRQKCKADCDVVIGFENFDNDIPMDFDLIEDLDALNSPHIRREIPKVRLRLKGQKKVYTVTVMEYAPRNLRTVNLSPVELRPLYEDAIQGLRAMDTARAINSDIKPDNMALMEHNGQEYLSLADNEYLSNPNPAPGGVPNKMFHAAKYGAPEFHTPGALPTAKSGLWQLAASFFRKITGEELTTVEKLNALGRFDPSPEGIAYRRELHEQIMERMDRKLTRVRDAYKNKEIKIAIEEFRDLFTAHLVLDPNERQWWPEEVPRRRDTLVMNKERLEIPESELIRPHSGPENQMACPSNYARLVALAQKRLGLIR